MYPGLGDPLRALALSLVDVVILFLSSDVLFSTGDTRQENMVFFTKLLSMEIEH